MNTVTSNRKLKKKPEHFRLDVGGKQFPVETEQQRQTIIHEKILEKGNALLNKSVDDQNEKLYKTIEQKRDTMENLMDRRLQIGKANIMSEYERNMKTFTDHTKEKLNKALIEATADIRKSCEEHIKQCVSEVERTALAHVQTSVIEREKRLREQFERFKEQNATDFKNYYGRLMASYRQRFENQLEDVKKKHDEKYDNLKKSLEKKYKEDLASRKIIYQRTLSSNQPQSPSALPVVDNDEANRQKVEWLVQQRDKKLNDLNRKSKLLIFYKSKIKSVLNNYCKIVTVKKPQISGVHHGLDKKMLFEKYLGPPTFDELEQLSISDDKQ